MQTTCMFRLIDASVYPEADTNMSLDIEKFTGNDAFLLLRFRWMTLYCLSTYALGCTICKDWQYTERKYYLFYVET